MLTIAMRMFLCLDRKNEKEYLEIVEQVNERITAYVKNKGKKISAETLGLMEAGSRLIGEGQGDAGRQDGEEAKTSTAGIEERNNFL